MVFIVLVPTVPNTDDGPDGGAAINEAGFVCLVVLQCLADLMLLLALDHEQRFRSSGMAINITLSLFNWERMGSKTLTKFYYVDYIAI